MEYEVVRISKGKQNIERQVRNILGQYTSAKIFKGTYTKIIVEEIILDKMPNSKVTVLILKTFNLSKLIKGIKIDDFLVGKINNHNKKCRLKM